MAAGGGQTVRPASKQKKITPVSWVRVKQAKTTNNTCSRPQAGKKRSNNQSVRPVAAASKKTKQKNQSVWPVVAASKQSNNQPVWLVRPQARKNKTKINMCGRLRLQAKNINLCGLSWLQASLSQLQARKKTINLWVGWWISESRGKQSSSERAKNYLPVLVVTSRKNKTTLNLCGLSPPQARQNPACKRWD